MKKSERKALAKILDGRFITALFMYALGFAFIATMACYFMITDVLDVEIILTDWMVIVLPTILLLFITYVIVETISYYIMNYRKIKYRKRIIVSPFTII